MDTEQWLAQYKDKVEGVRQAAAELTDNIAAATVTASSPDGSVTVTIGPNGSLRDLRFGNRASEHSHAQLAALVMKTVAQGQRAVAEKVVEAFAPVGDGTSAMDLLTKYVPEDTSEERREPDTYGALAADNPPPPPPVRSGPPPAAHRQRPVLPVHDDIDDFAERPW